MVYILPEVLVTIADCADSQTIHGLMLTCRRFRQILDYHERSVVKGKLDAYRRSAIDPRVFRSPKLLQDHPLLQLYGDTDGTVLTSDSPKRTVARPYSYAIVRELEVRERRIQSLFRPGSFLSNTIGHLHSSSDAPTPQEALQSIQRAVRISDLVGDCVARIVARAGWTDGYNAHLADDHHRPRNSCRCNCWVSCLTNVARDGGVVVAASSNRHLLPGNSDDDDVHPRASLLPSPTNRDTPSSLSPSQVRERENKDVVMAKLAYAVRAAQTALVRRLSAPDMLWLATLCEAAGAGYSAATAEPMRESDPEHAEKRTAFQESVLRRGGSLSLWAVVGGGTAMECKGGGGRFAWGEDSNRVLCDEMAQDAVRAVHWELFLWEMGYGADRVSVKSVFEPVGDEGLARLIKAFDEAVRGGGEGDNEEGEGEVLREGDKCGEEITVPAMQRGLQPTLIRSLSRRDQKLLTARERRFAQRMRPYDGSEG